MVNPITYILGELNSISLRTSIELGMKAVNKLSLADIKTLNDNATTTLPFLQDVTARTFYPTVVYHSNMPWLWAAIASLLFCVACVLPSYYGFWKLGRKVTLGETTDTKTK